MKFKWSHVDLAYPNPKKVSLSMLAESEFEKSWLHVLAKSTKDFKFQFKYPNYEPAELNNPCITLEMCIEEESPEAEVKKLRHVIKEAEHHINKGAIYDHHQKAIDLLRGSL